MVYNVHYESRSYGRIQLDQLAETIEDMKRYPAGTSFLLAGDMNSKYFPSIFLDRLKKEGFQNSTGDKIERTHELVGSLDWILARGPVKLEAGRVRRDIGGSDHLPDLCHAQVGLGIWRRINTDKRGFFIPGRSIPKVAN